MEIRVNDKYALKDQKGNLLGNVTILQIDKDLISGDFEEGINFQSVRGIFRAHEKAANQQLLSNVDEIEFQIEALGPHLYSCQSDSVIKIHNLQIMNVKDICFRLAAYQYIAPERRD